ncbi:MAG: hypothetical protein R2912_09330 [Eubacteriales bacterium]
MNHNPGHTPWLHFAKILKRTLGYPISLVMCAYGGSPLPALVEPRRTALTSYRSRAARGLRSSSQGDALVSGRGGRLKQRGNLSGSLLRCSSILVRTSLNQPELPVITFQLNRQFCESDLALDRQWGIVRQAQQDAMYQLQKCLHARCAGCCIV